VTSLGEKGRRVNAAPPPSRKPTDRPISEKKIGVSGEKGGARKKEGGVVKL